MKMFVKISDIKWDDDYQMLSRNEVALEKSIFTVFKQCSADA